QPVALDFDRVAGGRFGAHALGGDFGDDGRDQVVAAGMPGQGLLDGVVLLVLIVRQVDKTFRPAVTMALVVGQHIAPDRVVGRVLLGLGERGIDIEALGIGLALV